MKNYEDPKMEVIWMNQIETVGGLTFKSDDDDDGFGEFLDG